MNSFMKVIMSTSSRRDFMTLCGITAAATTLTSHAVAAPTLAPTKDEHIIRFGLLADAHVDIAPRGRENVYAFLNAMKSQNVDFIMGLGDFCFSKDNNKSLMKEWHDFPAKSYHVLGNHEMDLGVSREQAKTFFGMPALYYTFDAGPIMGVILDGNDTQPRVSGYPRAIAKEQQVWLDKVLSETKKPAVLFIHQPFAEGPGASLVNTKEVLALLKRHKDKVMAVFSGHQHRDQMWMIDGIAHVTLSSASYAWMEGMKRVAAEPSAEIRKRFPHYRNMAFTRDPLWAVVEIDTTRKTIAIQGQASVWEGLSPGQCGANGHPDPFVPPYISNRYIELS